MHLWDLQIPVGRFDREERSLNERLSNVCDFAFHLFPYRWSWRSRLYRLSVSGSSANVFIKSDMKFSRNQSAFPKENR